MLTSREINRECEFPAQCDHTARDIGARDGARIPGVNEKQNGFQGDACGIALIGHDFQAIIQISVEAFDEHRVVVGPVKT